VNAFVTGTDTGVGKTLFTALLTRCLREAGRATVALKPVCCGLRTDAERLCAASGGELTLDETNPLWFPEPVAPAAACGDSPPAVGGLVDWFFRVSAGRDSVLVEGAGGWLVPLAPGRTMADFAVRIGLPVLVVVPNRLGCLNHALLTVESILSRELPCLGFVLNHAFAEAGDLSTSSNKALLEEASGLPVLIELPRDPLRISMPGF
jgi:dethiobiotin synthetase